jgi:hypothetical protein
MLIMDQLCFLVYSATLLLGRVNSWSIKCYIPLPRGRDNAGGSAGKQSEKGNQTPTYSIHARLFQAAVPLLEQISNPSLLTASSTLIRRPFFSNAAVSRNKESFLSLSNSSRITASEKLSRAKCETLWWSLCLYFFVHRIGPHRSYQRGSFWTRMPLPWRRS